MTTFATKVYAARAGMPLKHVYDVPLVVADDADRCREVVFLTMPEEVKLMENIFMVSKQVP